MVGFDQQSFQLKDYEVSDVYAIYICSILHSLWIIQAKTFHMDRFLVERSMDRCTDIATVIQKEETSPVHRLLFLYIYLVITQIHCIVKLLCLL